MCNTGNTNTELKSVIPGSRLIVQTNYQTDPHSFLASLDLSYESNYADVYLLQELSCVHIPYSYFLNNHFHSDKLHRLHYT